MTTLQDVLDHAGGVVKLARVLRITPQAVSLWKPVGKIPELQAYKIAELWPERFRLSDLPVKRRRA